MFKYQDSDQDEIGVPENVPEEETSIENPIPEKEEEGLDEE